MLGNVRDCSRMFEIVREGKTVSGEDRLEGRVKSEAEVGHLGSAEVHHISNEFEYSPFSSTSL